MEIIRFTFGVFLYLILAIAGAKWFASRLRPQGTVAAGTRAKIKNTETVLPIMLIASITVCPRDRKRTRFFGLLAEEKPRLEVA